LLSPVPAPDATCPPDGKTCCFICHRADVPNERTAQSNRFAKAASFHGLVQELHSGDRDGTKSMSERMRDNEVFEVWLVRERSKIQEGVASLVASIESQRGRNTNGRATRSMCRRVGGRGIFIVAGGVSRRANLVCPIAPRLLILSWLTGASGVRKRHWCE
jgi:hypothetical protein